MKIAHFADLHLSNDNSRLNIQRELLDYTIDQIKQVQPDIIVFAGDTFDKETPKNETKVAASEFFNELSKYCNKIIINKGNHEQNQKNFDRISSIESFLIVLNNPKIEYLSKTGFYYDNINKIIWSNWNFGDKTSPYYDNIEEYDKIKLDYSDYFIIDVFHNPINGTVTHSGEVFNDTSYNNLQSFKGDLLLAGDIHQYQTFKRDGKVFGAYPSSTFQQNFGESIEEHGFILWNIDITNKKITSHKLINSINPKYAYHNIHIPINYDYDNINVEIDVTADVNYIKFHLRDYKANINTINKNKLKTYIKKKYGSKIYGIIFFKDIIINSDNTVQSHVNNVDNVSDKTKLKGYFVDYITKTLKYDDSFAQEILEIDEMISERIESSISKVFNNEWKIKKLYIDNFRTFGEPVTIDLSDKNGIFQIMGENYVGKSKLYDAICYVNFGKTLDTAKTMKYGDSRFINYYNDTKDYCLVEEYLEINSKNYLIERKTERKWNRTGTALTACPTTVNFYELDENLDIIQNNNEDIKQKTKLLLEESIGTFNDFLRASFINSATLNDLLSSDRSVFLDSILKDLGLDVFDIKLKEFKNLKKNQYTQSERINIDVPTEEVKISFLENQIIENNNIISENKSKIEDISISISNGIKYKEGELKKLIPINESLRGLTLEYIDSNIQDILNQKDKVNEELNTLNNRINSLPISFDENILLTLEKQKSDKKQLYYTYKQEINDINNKISSNDNDKSKVRGDVILLEREISNLENKISSEIKLIDNKIQNELSSIKLKTGSKVCPTCNREKDANSILEIEKQILEHNTNISNLELEKTSSKTIISFQDKIIELRNNIAEKNNTLPSFDDINISLKENIKEVNNKISENELYITDVIDPELSNLLQEKKDFQLREKLLIEKDNFPSRVENLTLKLEKEKNNRELLILQQKNIELNNKIQSIIDKADEKIKRYQEEKSLLERSNYSLANVNSNNLKTIEDTQNKIIKYNQQIRKELINKTYEDCISRDGLPTMILRNSIDIINSNLNDLLTNLHFNLYFNNDIEFLMSKKIDDSVTYAAIEASGFERTIISIILRFALRKTNIKNRNNILLIDEVFGTIHENNVDLFLSVINEAKKDIEKIFIIEHSHEELINPDYLIKVTYNQDKQSSELTFN
jgi:DNA repair exonuclease SbcCD ATPase subunit/DNA repair exonuclease SbcCD nuclease subunit